VVKVAHAEVTDVDDLLVSDSQIRVHGKGDDWLISRVWLSPGKPWLGSLVEPETNDLAVRLARK
jgi:hypothetical protein